MENINLFNDIFILIKIIFMRLTKISENNRKTCLQHLKCLFLWQLCIFFI